MRIELSTQLLIEASSKIAGFKKHADEAVLITLSNDDDALDFDLGEEESASSLPSNTNVMRIMSVLCVLLINHSNGVTTKIKQGTAVSDFLKYITSESDVPTEKKIISSNTFSEPPDSADDLTIDD